MLATIKSDTQSAVTIIDYSTGSGSHMVNHGSQRIRKYRMIINDQVATAPCTDPIQE
jgi:hypothetical protein